MFIVIPANAACGSSYPPSETYPCHTRRHRIASISILCCTIFLSLFLFRLFTRTLACLLSFSLFPPSLWLPHRSPSSRILIFTFLVYFAFWLRWFRYSYLRVNLTCKSSICCMIRIFII